MGAIFVTHGNCISTAVYQYSDKRTFQTAVQPLPAQHKGGRPFWKKLTQSKSVSVWYCGSIDTWLTIKDTNFTFYIWLNPLSLSSTPTMSFEGRWPKQPDPHNSLCRTFPRLEIKEVIQCHKLHTHILIVWLFIPSSPVSFCGAPGSLRLRSSCRCLRRAPPSANHLQKYQLLIPCKS